MDAEIRLGTSSFTADGWNGAFYPKGMKSADYIRYYSSRFDTVEVDSTFYRYPTIEAVNNWALKTPSGFIFSLKIPQTITHQKILVDCEKEFEEFVSTVEVLGEKFALVMTLALGLEVPLSLSVFSASAGAFLLATCGEYSWSLDSVLRWRLGRSG